MVELKRWWGRAENGDVCEVALRPHLAEELLRRWPPVGLERHDSAPDGPVIIRRGLSDSWIIIPDVEESGDGPPLAAWDQLEQSLTVFTSVRLTRLVAVHAAAIAWNDQVLVVPASSGNGKSTLALAAHEAGAKVLSDEYALIDPADGLVTGWCRNVRMVRGDGGVDRIDVAVPSDPMPVGLVAVVKFAPEQATEAWEPLTPGEAVGELLAHTICAQDRPHDSFDAALAVAKTARAVRGDRGEASQAIEALLAMLDG